MRENWKKFDNLNEFTNEEIEKIKLRFWNKIEVVGECWEWTAWRFPQGYGGITIGGRTVRANRLAYILTHGEVPNGLWVLHKCNNYPCINPDHLYAGTSSQNAIDRENSPMSLKGDRNGSRLHPDSRPWGIKVNTVKLTPEQVLEIRNSYKFGEITANMLGDKYGLSSSNVIRIVKGKSWKRIGGPIFAEPTKEQISEMKRRAARGTSCQW